MFIRMLKLEKDQRTAHDLSTHQVAIYADALSGQVKRQMINWWGPILVCGVGAERVDADLIEWLQKRIRRQGRQRYRARLRR